MAEQIASPVAVKVLGRFIASGVGRRHFASNGFQNGTPIVVCDADESIDSAMGRAYSNPLPVLLAIHFPQRAGREQFGFTVLQSTDGTARDGGKVGVRSTIGMLYDSLQGFGRTTFDFGNFGPAELGSYELTGA